MSTSTAAERLKALRAKVEGDVKSGPGVSPRGEADRPVEATTVAPEGKVRLSTLIPSIAGTREFDPYVTVWQGRPDVPAVNPGYVPNPKVVGKVAFAIENDPAVLAVVGPPSAGKTSLVEYVCGILGRPFYSVQCSGDAATYQFLIGSKELEDGRTVWRDGVVPRAMRTEGAVLLLDELMQARPEVINSLMDAFNVGGKLTIGEAVGMGGDGIVHKADGFKFAACDNTLGMGDLSGEFAGVEIQNSALLDRIGIFAAVELPGRQQETAILEAMGLGLSGMWGGDGEAVGVCQTIARVAAVLRQAYRAHTLPVLFSVRTSMAVARFTAATQGDLRMALEMAFIDRLPDEGTKAGARDVINGILGS